MRAVIAGLLLVSLQSLAAETPLRPDDFAYGMTLQDGSSGAIYGLELPEEVYRHVTRPDLGDLRVFNANGEVVPSQLQRPQAAAEISHAFSLPFYPVFVTKGKQGGETTLRIVPDRKGAVIDLHSRAGQEGGKEITHYILDATALHEPIRRLQLQWQASDETFVTNVTVEASDDLSHWRQIGSGSLAELFYGGYHLQRNELQLCCIAAGYLRLSWPLDDKKVVLTGVEAEVTQPGNEAPLHWSVARAIAADSDSGEYRFASNGYFPVERLEVGLPQQNTLVQARLFSSDAERGAPWLQRYQGVLYSLQQEGQTLTSAPIAINRTSQRYWRLAVDQQSGGLGAGQPQLRLGWRAQRLLFVARGNGPYTLAFGSARAAPLPVDSNLQGVLAALQQGRAGSGLVKSVVPQRMYILGGEARLRPPPPPVPWQKWLLWMVLVVGVVAMLLMARSLYRQMNGGKGTG